MSSFALVLMLVIASLACIACKHKTVPHRPSGVPESAIWAGGADGGAFIECALPTSSKTNACTVYNDSTGDVWMSGAFALRGSSSNNLNAEPRFEYADGSNIGLSDGFVLEPKTVTRPQAVPESASLAENGVFVSCTREKTDLFRCELFLAADGRKLSSGIYMSDDGPLADAVKPKLADTSAIYLEGGHSLSLASPKSR
jgi:hypothetical protein